MSGSSRPVSLPPGNLPSGEEGTIFDVAERYKHLDLLIIFPVRGVIRELRGVLFLIAV